MLLVNGGDGGGWTCHHSWTVGWVPCHSSLVLGQWPARLLGLALLLLLDFIHWAITLYRASSSPLDHWAPGNGQVKGDSLSSILYHKQTKQHKGEKHNAQKSLG